MSVVERGVRLRAAAAAGDLGAVRAQLKHVDVDAADQTTHYTALHRSVANGHYEVARELLGAGASPFALHAGGHTPIELAVEFSQQHILALFERSSFATVWPLLTQRFLQLGGARREGVFRLGSGGLDLWCRCCRGDAKEAVAQTSDVHAVAGAIKQALRHLPEPAIPSNDETMYDACVKLGADPFHRCVGLGVGEGWDTMACLLRGMPEPHRWVLAQVSRFFAVLSEPHTGMSPAQLGKVLAPNLFRHPVS